MALLEKYSKISKTIEESRKDQASILKHLDNIQTQLQEVKEERDLMTTQKIDAEKSIKTTNEDIISVQKSLEFVDSSYHDIKSKKSRAIKHLEIAKNLNNESQDNFFKKSQNFRDTLALSIAEKNEDVVIYADKKTESRKSKPNACDEEAFSKFESDLRDARKRVQRANELRDAAKERSTIFEKEFEESIRFSEERKKRIRSAKLQLNRLDKDLGSIKEEINYYKDQTREVKAMGEMFAKGQKLRNFNKLKTPRFYYSIIQTLSF